MKDNLGKADLEQREYWSVLRSAPDSRIAGGYYCIVPLSLIMHVRHGSHVPHLRALRPICGRIVPSIRRSRTLSRRHLEGRNCPSLFY